MKTRRKYTEAFKRRAILRLEKGEPTAAIEKALKISSSMLYQWKRKLKNSIRTQQPQVDNNLKEVIIYLHHARDAMFEELEHGTIKRLLKSHVLTLLALYELTGER